MVDTAQISITGDDTQVTIDAGGTLDLTNTAELQDGLRQAAMSAEKVTVDMRDADFIDTQVVQDLARAAVTMLKRGKRLKVIASETGYPLRVIRISGFENIMDVEPVPVAG
jgi:anti-anti-sigma factor